MTSVVQGRSPIFLRCPAHGDSGRPNLAVYPDGTYCFACGFRETPEEFTRRITGDPGAARVDHAGDQPAPSPVPRVVPGAIGFWHRTLVEGPLHERLAYLEQRGFTLDAIRRYRFGHTGLHFVLPVWEGQRVTGVQFRVDPRWADPEEPRYRSPAGQPTLLVRPNPGGQPPVICEGPLDCYLLAWYGADAVTTTGGVRSLFRVLDEFDRRERVFLLTDQDEAGEEMAQEILRRRPRWVRVRFAAKDVGEALMGTSNPLEVIRTWFGFG